MNLRVHSRIRKWKRWRNFPGISNYYIGIDPSQVAHWNPELSQSDISRRVSWHRPVAYYGNPGLLESDFVVAPGADPSVIEWDVEWSDEACTSMDLAI